MKIIIEKLFDIVDFVGYIWLLIWMSIPLYFVYCLFLSDQEYFDFLQDLRDIKMSNFIIVLLLGEEVEDL